MLKKLTIILVIVLLIQFAAARSCKKSKDSKKVKVNCKEPETVKIVAFPIPCGLANLKNTISIQDSHECGRKKCSGCKKCGKKTCTCSSDCAKKCCKCSSGCGNTNCNCLSDCEHADCDCSCDCGHLDCNCSCDCGHSSCDCSHECNCGCKSSTSKKRVPLPPKIKEKETKKDIDLTLPKLDCDKKILPCIDCDKFNIPAVEIPKLDLSGACRCMKTFMENKARIHCEKLNCLQSVLPPLKLPQFPKLC